MWDTRHGHVQSGPAAAVLFVRPLSRAVANGGPAARQACPPPPATAAPHAVDPLHLWEGADATTDARQLLKCLETGIEWALHGDEGGEGHTPIPPPRPPRPGAPPHPPRARGCP